MDIEKKGARFIGISVPPGQRRHKLTEHSLMSKMTREAQLFAQLHVITHCWDVGEGAAAFVFRQNANQQLLKPTPGKDFALILADVAQDMACHSHVHS